MHDPIDTAALTAELQERFKGREALVMFCRDYLIPAMNDAYRDGKVGVSGYGLDPAAEIAAFEKAEGPLSAQGRRRVAVFIRCLNAAYTQGQQDAQRGAEA